MVLFQGKVTLPTESEMVNDIKTKESAMSNRYVKSKRHTIQVDYLPYMDELSGINGNKPDFGMYETKVSSILSLGVSLENSFK